MLINKISLLILLSVFGIKLYAQESAAYKLFEQPGYTFPYKINEPDKQWQLPEKLIEISGLSYIGKRRLACVQDEKGNIYFLSSRTGNVIEKIDFYKDGDYEGIAVTNDHIWVLKSDGDLFRVKFSKNDNSVKTKKIETGLTIKNDTEGLAYDSKNNQLLIACKGQPNIDNKKGKSKKAIYSFDIKEKKLSKKPVFKIDLDEIKELKKYNPIAKFGIDFLAYFYPSKGDVSFQPSGIAVHPVTNNIYIIGSVGKLLIVCNPEGEFLAVTRLNYSLFVQPEGICFDPDGNLYISNEGQETVATILKFKPQKP